MIISTRGAAALLLSYNAAVGFAPQKSFLHPTTKMMGGHHHHPRGTSSVSFLRMATASSSAAAASHEQQQQAKSGTAPAATDPRSIRNVALVGHSHSGKTALTEWMMYDEHLTTKQPTPGSYTHLDSDPIEASRHSSIFSHFVRLPHKKAVLEVSDTPWGDFPSDATAALDGADSALLVVSAPDGVQSGTVSAYKRCVEANVRTMVTLSKMDRPFVNVQEVLDGLEVELGAKPVPLQIPIFGGEESTFTGVKPLLTLNDDGTLIKNAESDTDDALQEAWMALEEAVAMTDDDLLVEYLEDSTLEPDRVLSGLRTAVKRGQLVPLTYTSAETNAGVSELMDAMVGVLPDPVEMREEVLLAACQAHEELCGKSQPGIESGFAARVLHTTVDSYGSLSVLRIISNDFSGSSGNNKGKNKHDEGGYGSLPHETINLRTGDKIKMPSASASFGLCGKDRLPLADHGAHLVPGSVIAVPKLPDSVKTNDVLTIASAVQPEEAEIELETVLDALTPLSRSPEDFPLMAAATVSLVESKAQGGGGGKKKSKGGGGGGGGDDKLTAALAALAREDLAVRIEQDAASGMPLLRCMNGEHLKLIASRLQDRYGLDVELGRPPVPYRETIVKAVQNIEGRHKKQSGGSGQFGVCYISMEPLEEGTGIEFESKIKGGAISKPFISSVERGIREQLQAGGPLGGFPVTDVKVTLTDGKMHSVDSKDIAFQSAGRIAVKAALERGKTRLLQPMDKITFHVDESLQGDVNTILSRQDGYVTSSGPSSEGGGSGGLEIEAIVPTASVADVSDALRAASAGEGRYVTEFAFYQPVQDNLIEGILEQMGDSSSSSSSSGSKLMP